jgi:hypothetical protein
MNNSRNCTEGFQNNVAENHTRSVPTAPTHTAHTARPHPDTLVVTSSGVMSRKDAAEWDHDR